MMWYNNSQNIRQVYNSATDSYIMIRGITNFLKCDILLMTLIWVWQKNLIPKLSVILRQLRKIKCDVLKVLMISVWYTFGI